MVGISDNQKILKKIFFLNKLVEKNYFNLVIIHKPELFKSYYNNVDLMLCGHTHRGQISPTEEKYITTGWLIHADVSKQLENEQIKYQELFGKYKELLDKTQNIV